MNRRILNLILAAGLSFGFMARARPGPAFSYVYPQKVVVVTGAFSGLGLELSKELLAKGYAVALAGRDVRKAPKLTEWQNGDRGFVVRMDLSHEETLAPALAAIHNHFGRLDAIVHNAGQVIQDEGPEFGMDSLRRSIQVNFLGAVELTNLAMKHFKEQKYGRVIYISSAAAVMLQPGMSPYSTSKAAAETHFKTLALELADEARRSGSDIDAAVFRIGVVRGDYVPAVTADAHGSGQAVSDKLMTFLRSISPTTPKTISNLVIDTIEHHNGNRFIRVGLDGKLLSAMSLVPPSITTMCARLLTSALD